MSNDNSDYLAYARETSGGAPADLTRLAELAEKQAAAELAVKRAEDALQKAQDELRKIAEGELPELMDSLGLEEFRTATGLKIEVKEMIRASIPKPREAEAFAWLRANNHDALIKRSLVVSFGKGEDDEANTLGTQLTEEGYSFDDKQAVHAQTLSAFVREQLEKGKEIPIDLLGVFRQRKSKVGT
jgi:hypothetical protein